MCIFCKIVNGEIPCYKIYEDKDCLAFLDISQATIGHTLVIPKEHYENAFEIDEDLASKVFKVALKLSKQIKKNLNIENLNIINNNGSLSGQTINHFHIHLIPRYKEDNMLIQYSQNTLSIEDFNKLLNKIK